MGPRQLELGLFSGPAAAGEGTPGPAVGTADAGGTAQPDGRSQPEDRAQPNDGSHSDDRAQPNDGSHSDDRAQPNDGSQSDDRAQAAYGRSSSGDDARAGEAPRSEAGDGSEETASDEGTRQRLSAELERAALHQIRESFAHHNGNLFRFTLRTPTFELVSDGSLLGCWEGATRTLKLHRRLLTDYSWGTLVEVLKHEMAHQYVDEVLGNPDGRPHGETFQRICRERGIDPAASGVPVAQSTPAESRVLERIAKLLALAESPNLNEAQAAMSAARRLMLKHNIAQATQASAGRYAFRHIGRPTGRRSPAERVLGVILSEHFFVEVIWVPVWRPLEGKRGSVIEACGTLENLEIAAYVYDFLLHTSERLWLEHKRARKIEGNADRQSFLYGVMRGFLAKLEGEARQARKEGLVWVGDAGLAEYCKARHPYTRTSHVRASGQGSAFRAGHAAGQNIVLHRGVRSGPDRSAGPRLLPGK